MPYVHEMTLPATVDQLPASRAPVTVQPKPQAKRGNGTAKKSRAINGAKPRKLNGRKGSRQDARNGIKYARTPGMEVYTPELADIILKRIAAGESLKVMCDEPELPTRPTVLKWCWDDTAFAKRYARAREDQADAYVEEAIDLARATTDRDSAAKARVLCDMVKWAAGKLKPHVYGDMTRLAGHDGGQLTVAHQVETAITAQRQADTMRRKLEAKRAGDDAIDVTLQPDGAIEPESEPD